MTDARERLSMRRPNISLEFDHINADGRAFHYTATAGFYDDGRVGEVFLGSTKIGTDTDIAIKDAAIALSLALQCGCPLEVFQRTFLRNARGEPEGPLGTLVDLISREVPAI